jgi:hypothetical protein
MKKAILHIGAEKTGSTSIQSFCSKNSNKLLSDYKILYPKTPGVGNHTKLAIYSCDESRGLKRFLNMERFSNLGEFRDVFEKNFLLELEEKITNWDTVLLSSEWLHPRMRVAAEFSRLHRLLDKIVDRVEIILYIRRQDKLAQSLYSTSLKAGNSKQFKFPAFINNSAPYFYDFLSIYKNWAQYFGFENVRLRIFDKDILIGNDIVHDFIDYLNVDSSRFEFAERKNLSLSDDGIILMRSFNECIGSREYLTNEQRAKEIRQKISKFFSGKPNLATDNDSKLFQNKFTRRNNELFDDYYSYTGGRLSL